MSGEETLHFYMYNEVRSLYSIQPSCPLAQNKKLKINLIKQVYYIIFWLFTFINFDVGKMNAKFVKALKCGKYEEFNLWYQKRILVYNRSYLHSSRKKIGNC